MKLASVSVLALASFASLTLYAAEPTKVIELWPGGAPGEKGDIGEEHDTTKPTDELIAGKRVIRLGNVSKPTIAVYPPEASKNTSIMVVFRLIEGRYSILFALKISTSHWLIGN